MNYDPKNPEVTRKSRPKFKLNESTKSYAWKTDPAIATRGRG